MYFQVSYFKLAGSLGIVSLSASVLKGIDFVTLAMCAICSCLYGDRMAPNNLFPLSIGGLASASRFGRVCLADMQGQCQTAPPAQL